LDKTINAAIEAGVKDESLKILIGALSCQMFADCAWRVKPPRPIVDPVVQCAEFDIDQVSPIMHE
jgi:hypothetical protein